jgi:hypothetical protein
MPVIRRDQETNEAMIETMWGGFLRLPQADVTQAVGLDTTLDQAPADGTAKHDQRQIRSTAVSLMLYSNDDVSG